MALEYFVPSFLYTLGKDAWAAIRGRKRHLTPAEVVQLRQKWKPIFERELGERRRAKLNVDVIIHDVKRHDQYPEIREHEKDISAWFKVGLMDTYHGGILVGLSWDNLVELPDGKWRLVDYSAHEKGDLKVLLIGKIPYERIEAVDWDGDEYYNTPHIFCHFDGPQRQPYEELVYSEERHLNEHPFYVDIATAEDVRKVSKKHGINR